MRLVAAPLPAPTPFFVAGCGVPAGLNGHADEDTPIDAAMKLKAYDVSVIGIDLKDARKTHRGQNIVRAKPGGEYVVSSGRVKP